MEIPTKLKKFTRQKQNKKTIAIKNSVDIKI